MDHPEAPHPEQFARRAGQVGALTDPLRLLALSVLAQEPHHALMEEELGRRLHLTGDALTNGSTGALDVLAAHGLIDRRDGVASLTLDAWQHFRSIVAPRSATPEGLPRGVPIAPDEVDWSRYPAVIRRIAQQLGQRFRTTFSQHTVDRHIADSYDELASRSQVSRHLPMLTNRLATDRLSSIAAARGITLRPVPAILFVCQQNAGRSQLASAWAQHLAGDLIVVASAGTDPAPGVQPVVRAILEEAGLSAEQTPRPLTDDAVRCADVIVTMGCGDACPVMPGRRYFDWPVQDPAGQPRHVVETIFEDIKGRVDDLLCEMGLTQLGRSGPQGSDGNP